MENKKLLSIAAIIGALSIGYYFVSYLPKANDAKIAQVKAEQVMQNQQKCRDAGQKAYEQDQKIHGDTVSEPKFSYNAELNTCLYAGGYNNTYKVCDGGLLSKCTRGSWERFVRDSYTNREIIAIVNWTTDGEDWTHTAEEIIDFDNQSDKLMGFQREE
jgi:hypothetical protein